MCPLKVGITICKILTEQSNSVALASAAGLSEDEILLHGTGIQRESSRAAIAEKLEDR